jgi:hypothetical protein
VVQGRAEHYAAIGGQSAFYLRMLRRRNASSESQRSHTHPHDVAFGLIRDLPIDGERSLRPDSFKSGSSSEGLKNQEPI